MIIALSAGYPHIRHMAADLTSSEMTELQALYWLEPDVGQRIDEGFARVLHLLWGVTGQKKTKTLEDCMPKRGPIDRKAIARKVSGQFEIMRDIERERRRRKKNG